MSIHAELDVDLRAATRLPAHLNADLNPARSAINAALIGLPRGNFSAEVSKPQDPEFRSLLETADLGPFTVTGLKPAVRSLRAIVTDISLELPQLYDRIGCSEMLACRYVKGSKSIVSNHAWGLALDLTIDGKGTTDGEDEVMAAMLLLAPIFNRHGFFWGVAFGVQDACHFEASDELIRAWAAAGAFDCAAAGALPRALTLGDRGPKVSALQAALNERLAPVEVVVDGLFGPQTRLAVFALQRRLGVPPSGAAPKSVLAALGLG